jgi:uncharacterized membrane protein YeaQ/YmgE (transglycosylase-associated protein family)
MLGALIFWIIVGLIAGALAKFIMPGDDPGGFIITILLGVAGAIVGGFLASLIGIGGGGTIWTIIIATIGAIILLAIYRAVAGGRAARSQERFKGRDFQVRPFSCYLRDQTAKPQQHERALPKRGLEQNPRKNRLQADSTVVPFRP